AGAGVRDRLRRPRGSTRSRRADPRDDRPVTASASARAGDGAGVLGLLEQRVHAAVERRRARRSGGDDALRGLYVTDDDVDRLLDGSSSASRSPVAAAIVGERLERLVRAFRLEPVDVELLLVAVAPDLD